MENQEVNPIPATPSTPTTPITPGTQILMPGSIMWMVFGIVSCCFCFYGWAPMFGWVFAIIALVFGILAFIRGKKMQKDFDADPSRYKKASGVFVKVARITGLVGLIWGAVDIILSIILSIVLVAAESTTYYY
jgi:hypothetical protein